MTLANAAEFKAAEGRDEYVSEWLEIDQSRINQFADATDDHQWIHVDVERAKKESPFGGPIAHGFLTLALIPMWLEQCVPMQQKMGVNYGMNKVRFMSPVPAGAKLRAKFVVRTVTDVEASGVQVIWRVTLEKEGSDKPVCIAEFITRHYF
ncbi:dehydratase [Caballeronia udeis]|uniref:Dehydratase n=1 Tax=Caballeronia udeis TaxID=1232866 RepID=A0A158FZJ1_9BURK|nr:MaoC family dehydratase [Caballeronia udeis]SAL25057.1 dehydratase [Caballeronia udeis]